MDDGLIVVDKPAGWTSHDVVAKVRRLAGTRRVGHAGTLDPMATGVLVIGIGRATRLLTYLVGADKEYSATIRLGASTTTDDAEGEVLESTDATALTDKEIVSATVRLVGVIDQVPSAVSAIKVEGQRAYARVRSGEEVQLEARRVTVHRFDVTEVRRQPPFVDVDVLVTCSSGTYVRALARDLGRSLAVGGHLTALRRTRVGRYNLQEARSLEALEEDLAPVPLAEAARVSFPAREVSRSEAGDLSHGRRVPTVGTSGSEQAPVAAFAPDGALVALVADEGGWSHPVVVFTPA